MIDFPNTPTVGQIFVAPNGVSYQWDGTLWKAVSMTGGGTGDFYAGASITGWTSTATTPTTLVVQSGNASGSFVPGTGRFTPPAGRYHLCGGACVGTSAGATTVALYLRKNGTAIFNTSTTSQGTNAMAIPTFESAYDANGSDWFDIQVSSNNGSNISGWCWFGAFPIASGVPSPGFVGVPWRLISRQTLGSAAASMDVQNIPSDINDLMFDFDMTPVTNSTNIVLQMYDNTGTLDTTTNHYQYAKTQSNTGQAGGTAVLAYNSTSETISTAIVLNISGGAGTLVSSSAGIRGKGMIPNIRAARLKHLDWQAGYVDDANSAWRAITGSGYRNVSGAITGIRLVFGTGNVAAGSTLAVWGSP
jgi:hypothetical protein